MTLRVACRFFQSRFRSRPRSRWVWCFKPGLVAGGVLLLGCPVGVRLTAQPLPLAVTPFAMEVVAAGGPFGPAPYDDPEAVLGPPATDFFDPWGMWSGGDTIRRVKLVEAAYNLTPDQTQKLLLTLAEGAVVVVRFEAPLRDDPAHPYGVDLLVFGNAFFSAGMVNDQTDMNTRLLRGGGFFEPLQVSVSPGYTGAPGQDPADWETWDWYRYENGPYADTAFPTQAYRWDRARATWTDTLMDFTKPVNPALADLFKPGATPALTVADAIELYDGAGGGTGFDLRESGFDTIRYVKVEGRPGFSGGEIDAFAAVRPMVVGDSLVVAPGNLRDGPARLMFLQPVPPAEPALSLEVHALDGVWRVSTAPLAANDRPSMPPGTVLNAVALTLDRLRGEGPDSFVADLELSVGRDYPGDGRDLEVWQRSGDGWSRAPFTYLADQRAVVLRGLAGLTDVLVVRPPPPRLEIIPIAEGFALRFTPRPGWQHTVERSTDLTRWSALVQFHPPDAGPISWSDPEPPPAGAFYRLRLERP